MKIKLNTLSEMPIAVDSYGEKVSILLNLGSHLREQPFALIEKKMFGGSGEVFTPDRFISFKSNGGFSKLKKEKTINYSDIVEFEPFNGSTGLEWNFAGTTGKFTIGLMFYGNVKGIGPQNIFWYDIKEFPARAAAFYKLLSEVIPKTGLTANLKTSAVKNQLEEAMAVFNEEKTAGDIGLKLPLADVKYPGFHALQIAFSTLLAATTMATDSTKDSYLDIFKSMDRIYISILKKLMVDYNAKLGNLFTREQKIYEADEKFQRLSSLWYLRQIINLSFAAKYLPEDETLAWPLKVLKPRARTYRGSRVTSVEIKLPATEIYEDAIAMLEK
ncbi:MAG: hypothetical protein KAH31_06440 [Candidatus Sabulitectum sp.]|nr:hypothetical protein [Candidatus Sabulitectum sp.]